MSSKSSADIGSTAACAVATLFLIYTVSSTRSLVLTEAAWLSAFATSILGISTFADSFKLKSLDNFTYGLARLPVVLVFSSLILVQLSSVFILKESLEQHDSSGVYIVAGIFVFAALILSAYTAPQNPFNHVLSAAPSSIVQEHVADLSQALCHIIPGLSRLLLPRINSLHSAAPSFTFLTYYLIGSYEWINAINAVLLAFVVFTTLMPLSIHSGRILLQTVPLHIQNQIDRCVSEASRVEGVFELRNPHFWQVDFNSIAGTVDVRIRRDANEQRVLAIVTEKLSSVVHILNVQVLKDVTASWSAVSSMPMSSGLSSVPPPVPTHDPAVFHHEEHSMHANHGHSHEEHGHSHSGHGHGHSHNNGDQGSIYHHH
ncbi:hypothetical protein M3Y97_00935800 [Aphelenchoides bicaudatus]|nr:hypothetical protein M3Y97_00935800 [Aphelenchoides bicaudatus]